MPQGENYPMGEYEAEILSHEFQVSKNGNLMLVFRVQPLTFKGQEAPNLGNRFVRLMLTDDDNVTESLKKVRKFTGWAGKYPSELQSECLVGTKVPLEALQPRNGYDNFRFPRLDGGMSSQNAADKEKLRELDARYKQLLQKHQQGYSAPSPQPAQQQSTNELLNKLDDTDEIPF